MKKFLLLILLIPFMGFSQLDTTTVVVPIKEVAGIKIEGRYKVIREKEGKKEYKIMVYFTNTTDKEVFYKYSYASDDFGNAQLKGLSSYRFRLVGTKATKKVAGKKIKIIYPGTTTEAQFYYEKWYNENEVPEFEFSLSKETTLESDYTRYN